MSDNDLGFGMWGCARQVTFLQHVSGIPCDHKHLVQYMIKMDLAFDNLGFYCKHCLNSVNKS